MQQTNFKFLSIALLAVLSFIFSACNPGANTTTTTPDGSPETVATVNGKAIKLEQVERVIKQKGQGQETKLSQLDLAQARLQVLESLIQQEVMFQKADSEKTIPTDEDVTAEYNKQRTTSGLSVEAWDKKLQEIGETDQSAREAIKKNLAIQKLVEKVTSKVEPPKDSEIDAFYNGNKDAFVKKRGVKLAAIVVDPAANSEADTTKNVADATLKAKEIVTQLQQGADFASVAREKSEDNSGLQGGDLGYISEEAMKQNFSEQISTAFMNPKFAIGSVTPPLNIQGKFYIFKLQERIEKDEALTLESPGVRQQITDSLVNARKQLLAASYQAIAMNEAKIENYLAKRVVENPNELSGARPATANSNTNANTNTNTNTNINTDVNTNANTNTKVNTNSSSNMKTNTSVNTNTKVQTAPNTNANVNR